MSDIVALRRQLGWLLLWALLPLPFLYIVLPPFWLAAGAAALVLVVRPDLVLAPSTTLLNVAALVILVAVVAAGGLNVGPLRPLGHLLLLLTAVRVLLVHDRRSFRRSLALVGMVWVVSVASSTHMVVAVYFLMSAALGWWVGIRLHLDDLGLAGHDSPKVLPRLRHVLTAVAAALLIAGPLFILMPRLGSPWVAGRSLARSTGFSPDVDLGKLGRLTLSQEVAVIVRSRDGQRLVEGWTRLRGTAFDQVMAGAFLPRRTDLRQQASSEGLVWLDHRRRSLDNLTELEIDLLRPRRYLMLPAGTVAVQAAAPMALDPYGGVLVGYRRGRPLSYRVWVDEPRPPVMAAPTSRDLLLPRSHPEVRALALSVAGGLGSARARAAAVERFLHSEFEYSLSSGVPISNTDPVAWFLLEAGAGHCEFFAAAMVVMLRHLEVPARMVAGYSGGDLSPAGDELVVREANAHAWVEAWLGPDRGWVAYDPTPPVGVPGLGNVSGTERLRWAWQQLEMLWDQRLLTFGLGEQIDIVDSAVDVWRRGVEKIRGIPVSTTSGLVAAVVFAVLLGRVLWRRSGWRWRSDHRLRHGPASRAMNRLAGSLIPVGGVVPPWATVRFIGSQATTFWPSTSADVDELVALAELELYGPNGGDRADPAAARRLWKRIRQGMKTRELVVGERRRAQR